MPKIDAQDWIDPLTSTEKDRIRSKWIENTRELFKSNGPLTGIWLAGDRLEDLLPVIDCFKQVAIPEYIPDSYKRKRQTLSILSLDIRNKIVLEPMTIVEYLYKTEGPLDLVNYDACSHFHNDVRDGLEITFNRIVNGGMLFLTVANYSAKCGWHGEKYRRISPKMNTDIALVNEIAYNYGCKIENLLHPVSYRSNGNGKERDKNGRKINNKREMRSYGWKVKEMI